ncbi:MAG: ATP-binding protein [Acidimicrobiia bacterium]|nr:ATP-binding protein [Acidimicrobiia bacterium]
MNLRTRISLLVGGTVAVAIFAVAGASFAFTVREINVEADRFLRDRAGQISRIGEFPRGRFDGRGLFGPDRPIQLITEDGEAVAVVGVDEFLPVGSLDIEALGGNETGVIHTISTEHGSYRVVTIPVEGGGIMLAQELSEQEAVLDSLRDRFALIGILGAVLAGLIAWLVVTRTMQPMATLASAAEHVARTQELDNPIEVARADEVGRVARSFNTMLTALASSRRQQQRLIDDASHELRTPLTALRTNIDVLKRARDISTEQRDEILTDVGFELEELSTLVGELVALAKDVRTSNEPVMETDLGALVERVAERARRRYESIIEVTSDGSVVNGRPALLERAVSNLLDNAEKWNTDAGPIEVEVAAGRVSVRDHGPGIAEADKPRVFDRFYRSDAARTMPGSGLGLAIVDEIARGHEGSAFVEEADGGGAIVGFVLPVI